MTNPDIGQPHNLPALQPGPSVTGGPGHYAGARGHHTGGPGHYAGPPVQATVPWNTAPQFGPGSHGPAPVPGPPMHPQQQYARPTTVMITPKSPGIAVLLSFLWLGAGHLYCNRIGVGIALMIWDAFLILLSLTLIGWIISGPLWVVSVIPVMILAAKAATKSNERNGLIVR
jgi:TM2 domain-containing membrane protein YozV